MKENKQPYKKIGNSIMSHLRIIIGAVIVLVILFTISTVRKNKKAKVSGQPVAVVESGPLTISITESGVTRNKERAVIKSKVPGRKTVVWIIEEGVTVKEGDLLVELDSSDLVENQLERQIGVENGEASLIQARENLAIVKNQAEADVEKAQLDLKFAEMDLKKYEEGEYPQSLQKAETDITIAEEELQRSEDQLAWSKQLVEEGYVTRTELQADELSAKRNRINLDLVKGKLELLKKYTHDQELSKLQSDNKQAIMALERIKRKATANIIQAEAGLRAKDSEYTQMKKKLEDLMTEIADCRITAPSDGMAVYATGGNNPWHQREPLDVGQEVSERQELIYLPTSDKMIAQISVQEASRSKISEGMPTIVRIDAIPGEVFEGRINKIGILPDATQSWLNPDLKVYMCDIEILDSHKDMRPGMNCQIEIIIEEIRDAMYVPIQCVLRVDNKPTVFVKSKNGFKPQPVEIGLDNNRMIHIIGGLQNGDAVMLAPPLEAGSKPEGNGNAQLKTKPAVQEDAPEVEKKRQGAASDSERRRPDRKNSGDTPPRGQGKRNGQ